MNDGRMDTPNTESATHPSVLAKCEHDGCTCTVEAGQRFCSDYCLAQAGTEHAGDDHECQCGHAECEHVVAVPNMLGVGIA